MNHIPTDFAIPMRSNALTACGYLLRYFSMTIVITLIYIVAGLEFWIG